MLPEVFDGRLKPWPGDLPPHWRLWQHKTLNIHRGVMHWDATGRSCQLSEVRLQVREVVRECFRPSWWRGFGFGVVVSLSQLDESFQDVAQLVDVRNQRRGVWQWVVLHLPAVQIATGICTWTEGYLAPVYRDLLLALQKSGFECHSHQRDMDALLKTLRDIHEKTRALRLITGGLDALLG